MLNIKLAKYEIDNFSKKLISTFPENRIFVFEGEMGSGKTTLIKSICKEIKVVEQPTSPTFAVINEYHILSGDPVYHFDFYRIEKIEELEQIGVFDYLYSGYYCFIEWLEKAGDIMIHNDYIKIKITSSQDDFRDYSTIQIKND